MLSKLGILRGFGLKLTKLVLQKPYMSLLVIKYGKSGPQPVASKLKDKLNKYDTSFPVNGELPVCDCQQGSLNSNKDDY